LTIAQSDRFFLQLLALGFSSDISRLLTKLLLPDGYIPQGSPTSNAAIDLYFFRTDCVIENKLSMHGGRYTRFTDNLDTSFSNATRAPLISAILDAELTGLGLLINRKKEAENGWQPHGIEQIMCGVRIDSRRGTQLPSKVLQKLLQSAEALYHGARSAAPHTICGLARKRRSIQGWLNQASQADLAPVRVIQNRLRQTDFAIRNKLHGFRIFPRCEWYVKSNGVDVAVELAEIWRKRWRVAISEGVKGT
jgi:hypothetical protein